VTKLATAQRAQPPDHGGNPAFVPLEAPAQLRRVLGLPEVTASGIGIIIGAGIYVLLGAATAEAGATVWLAFLLAATLATLTGLSYAELSSMFPRAGGEFEYARQVFPAAVAFLVGWFMVVATVIGAAAVSLGFARYLGTFLAVDARVGALALLLGVTLVALGGIARSGRLTVILSVVQVGGLLAVIAIGIPHVGQVDLFTGPGPAGVVSAAALIFFAFIGFDEVITLAEETQEPTRTVPRALLLALGLSTLLYVGVAVSAVSVVGPDALAASPRPLADVFAHVLGERAGQVVAVIALVTTTNTTLLCLTAASRVLYGMASAGSFPPRLAHVATRTGAPDAAILACAACAAGVTLGRDLTLAASVTDAAVYATFLAVNVAVVLLRVRRPDLLRPFRSPGAVGGVPVLPILGIATIALVLPALPLRALLLSAGLGGIGLLIHAAQTKGIPR
jgi:basic amino acid/polyamine antiporter, APA family